MKTARGVTDDDGTYMGITGASLGASQPGLTYVDGNVPSTGPSVVSQLVVGTDFLYVSVFSKAGSCFLIRDNINLGSTFGTITPAASGDCIADNIGAVVFGSSW